MLRSIGKQSGESGESVSPGEEKDGYGGKDLQKKKVLSLEWKSDFAVIVNANVTVSITSRPVSSKKS